MSITVGDVLKVVAILSWVDGNIVQNVFNAVIGGAGGPYDDDDIVADAVTWLEAIYDGTTGNLSNDLTASEVRVYVYDPVDEDFDEVGSDVWSEPAGSAVDSLPRGVAGLINCKTLDPDVNGKKYIAGFTEAGQTDGLWDAGALAALASVAADWIAPFVGSDSVADWIPGVWSPTTLLFKAMSGTVIIPTIPAYQRRRKQGVGI